jgi:protein-arginine kinase activator protein McsA
MVDDNIFGHDFFDDFFDKDNDKEKNEKESFEEFLKEKNEEEGINKVSEFEDFFNDIFDEETDEIKGGKLISSITIEKGNDTYKKDVWQVDDIKITKLSIDMARSQEEASEKEKERYKEYIKLTLKDLEEELKHSVSIEDFLRAAELKKRITKLKEFLNN